MELGTLIKNKRLGEKVICGLMLVVGTGLCIGGIFIPFLMVFGAPMVAAGLGLFANIVHDNNNDKVALNNPTINNFNAFGEVAHQEVQESVVPKKRTIYRFKIKDPKHEPPLFAFNAKKDLEHSKCDAPDLHNETEVGYESLPMDIKEQIHKLNDIINKIDMSLIDKVAKEYNEKAYGHNNENNR